MQSIELNILNKLGSLDAWSTQLEQTVYRIIHQANDQLPLSDLTVTVIDKPQWTDPSVGLISYATDGHHIDIYLDSQFPNLEQAIQLELPRTLSHELHHAIRWRGPGYGQTLFEAFISEGLADHFSMDITDEGPRPWDAAITTEQATKLFAKAKSDYLSPYQQAAGWFFGSRAKQIPPWTGYTLGFMIVDNYLHTHPASTAATLVQTPAHEFITSIPAK